MTASTLQKFASAPISAVDQTIFLIEDEPVARQTVSQLLKSKGLSVEAYNSAESFLESYDRERRGCVVTDLRLSGMSGLELLEQLAKQKSDLPVVILTGYGNVPVAVQAMQQGAFSVLEKDCSRQELWQNVEAALACERTRRKYRHQRAEVDARLSTLSCDELEVLKHLIEGAPNKLIASQLDIGLRTVELRRAKILKKMGVANVVELARLMQRFEGQLAAYREN